jgi:hypothetical protein
MGYFEARGERAVKQRVLTHLAGWLAAAVVTLAGAGVDADAGSPVLLLILTAEGGEATEREQRLFGELELALDGFAIETVSSGDPEFARLPMSEQLARIQPLVDRSGAVATTWVEATGSGTVLLHLVALTTGRALVRIVEAHHGPDAEAELALAVRELLGEAYLFAPQPDDAAMERVVAEVKERVAPPPVEAEPALQVVQPPIVPEPEPDDTGTDDWSDDGGTPTLGLAPFALIGGGLAGHEGPHIKAGGGVGLEWPPRAALYGRVWLAITEGPDEAVRDGVVLGIGIAPGMLLGYRWWLGPVGLGPLLGVSAPWSMATMVIGDSEKKTYNWWDFRAIAGIEVQIGFGDKLGLFFDWMAGVHAVRQSFERQSDDTTVFATPFVDWDVLVGLVAYLG